MVADILRGLGFPATQRDGGFEVVVPAFRRDVAIEDDLVERSRASGATRRFRRRCRRARSRSRAAPVTWSRATRCGAS
jgi:hypothetical protein